MTWLNTKQSKLLSNEFMSVPCSDITETSLAFGGSFIVWLHPYMVGILNIPWMLQLWVSVNASRLGGMHMTHQCVHLFIRIPPDELRLKSKTSILKLLLIRKSVRILGSLLHVRIFDNNKYNISKGILNSLVPVYNHNRVLESNRTTTTMATMATIALRQLT